MNATTAKTERAAGDMTKQEQANVRAALRFLRVRCGGWEPLGKVLRFNPRTLQGVAGGRTVTASVAFRVARLVEVGVDGLLAGAFPPPGTCPHCGHAGTPPEERATVRG